jgi:hypothetical protein
MGDLRKKKKKVAIGIIKDENILDGAHCRFFTAFQIFVDVVVFNPAI